MSDTDYSGIGLALGTVRGLRAWRIGHEGTLESVTYSHKWTPGENVVDTPCGCQPEALEGEGWEERSERAKPWRLDGHDFATSKCGFYAYMTTKANYWYADMPVLGVVEGYGEVVIGKKGFRAKKARIVALCIEPVDGIWNLDEFVVRRIRANYPDVPMFESRMAMLQEFPLSSADEFADEQVEAVTK